MNTKNNPVPLPGMFPDVPDTDIVTEVPPNSSSYTPPGDGRKPAMLTPFWRERYVEVGLILSMLLYYIIGNPNLHILYFGQFSLQLNELISLPFLLLFAVLSWYRLPVAIALLPLALPFYLQQKKVLNGAAFSLAEVTLATCLCIATVRLVLGKWEHVSWSRLRTSVGPFLWPILVFCGVAALAILVAYARRDALRAFREEVLAPLLYLGLALVYLRTRQDLLRLVAALFGTGLLVACFGLAQYLFFKNTLVVGAGRVYAMYGSANSIGLLFDYVMPLGLAWVLGCIATRERLVALGACMIMLPVLYLTNSAGAWSAMGVALVFVAALSLRDRRFLLIGSVITLVGIVLVLLVFHTRIYHYVTNWHAAVQGQSSLMKRLYLWQSAWNMIKNSPWLGYGMDNWLCHYSKNALCNANVYHYWIKENPITHQATGLANEPNLSHPHNIFLHVWVSMGIFGVLAFIAVLVLFFWLFARILRHLSHEKVVGSEQLRWIVVGLGGGMLAALVQGMVDSAFLEQDLAFCFWMLVTALLLLRVQAGVSWKHERLKPEPMKHL